MAKFRSIKNAASAAVNLTRAIVNGDDLEVSAEVIADRLAKCDACPFREGHICSVCTCILTIKQPLATERCPRKEWKAVSPVKRKLATGANILAEEIPLRELLIGKVSLLVPLFDAYHATVAVAVCSSCAKSTWRSKLEVALSKDMKQLDPKDIAAVFYPSTHIKLGRYIDSLL